VLGWSWSTKLYYVVWFILGGGISCHLLSEWHGRLTRLWLVALESSSGNGFDTPRATQFAKMASKMNISKGLKVYGQGNNHIENIQKKRMYKDWANTLGKGYFHSTRASAAIRIGLLRVRQHRALGARRADLFACMCFLAPPALFCPAEPVELSVSVLLGSDPAKPAPSEIKGILLLNLCLLWQIICI